MIGNPQFGDGAALVSAFSASAVASDPSLLIKIPLADGNPKSRVYAYEVEVVGRQTAAHENARPPRLLKAVYAMGVNMGIGHEPAGGVTTLKIAKSELPPGKTLTVTAHPLFSLGTRGKPIVAEFEGDMEVAAGVLKPVA